MASSPFEVEDTDEDFFDRLVNDDIDFTESVHKPVEKKEFVDEKAFSKLSISEAGPVGVVDTGGNASLGVNGELGHEDGAVVEQLGVSQIPAVVKEGESMKPDSRNEASALDNIADNRKGVSLLDDRVDIRNAAGAWDDMADNRNEASALEDKAGNTNEAEALEDKGKEGSVNGTVNTSLASVGSGVKVAQWSSFNLDLNPSGEFAKRAQSSEPDSGTHLGTHPSSHLRSRTPTFRSPSLGRVPPPTLPPPSLPSSPAERERAPKKIATCSG